MGFLAVLLAGLAIAYGSLCMVLHVTQNRREPRLLPTTIPFLDPAIGIARHKVNYLVNLRKRFRLPIHTLRMPFQRLYVVNAPDLIQAIQTKANLRTFVPNLLDFGMLFSGLSNEGKKVMTHAVNTTGNSFTMSVHKYLLSGHTLNAATRTAIDRLAASVPNSFGLPRHIGLLEGIRHELTLALTGAIYGEENPYDDPLIEASWLAFVPGISHLLYSPFPWLTARKALRARSCIIAAFTKYFETGAHLQAFVMIPEMYKMNLSIGLSAGEAAKMEMATSLAMLSSGAITTFWVLWHILSDAELLREIRKELLTLITTEKKTTTGYAKLVDTSNIKTRCPNLMAVFHETLRYHSTLINIKKVAHDTTLGSTYLLKEKAIVMIPGTAVHHDTEIWGSTAEQFDYRRMLTAKGIKNLGISTAYRPFGAGATMCPGRNFSQNVILSLVAMILIQYDVEPSDNAWRMPTKWNADLWNAMPKPDEDVQVKISPRGETEGVEWKFVWGSFE